MERTKEILYEGFKFEMVRTKKYKIPEVVIREVLANAVIHRNYNEEHPIRIEIYDDRLSVFSPGSLYDGLQLKDILSGISKLRNKNIAEVFYNLGYIEKWGSGIQRSNQVLLDNDMQTLALETENIHGVTVTVFYEKINSVDMVKEGGIPSYDEVIKYYRQRKTHLKDAI